MDTDAIAIESNKDNATDARAEAAKPEAEGTSIAAKIKEDRLTAATAKFFRLLRNKNAEDEAVTAIVKLIEKLRVKEEDITSEEATGNLANENPGPLDFKSLQDTLPPTSLPKPHCSSPGQDTMEEHHSASDQDAGKDISTHMMDIL